MTNVQRYTWEDALLEAESKGLLQAGAVNLGLRLASAITWNTKGTKPSGLYWKNESALRKVGSSRATYFRYRAELFSAGFFVEEKGNLIPLVPDLSQSQVETDESHVETDLSQIETTESQVDTPYSVDTYPVDVSTVDTDSEEVTVSADASPVTPNYEIASPVLTVELPDLDDSFNYKGNHAVYVVDFEGVTKTAQSQIETGTDTPAVEGLSVNRFLTPGEKKELASICRTYKVDEKHAAEATLLLQTGPTPKDFYEAATDALVSVGAVAREEVEVW